MDPRISFNIGTVCQLHDGPTITIKILRDNVVKSLTNLSPTEAFDMCEEKFANDMLALGNYLQAQLNGKQFEGLFTLRYRSIINCLLTYPAVRYFRDQWIWDLSHVYKIQVLLLIHTLQRINAGASTRCTHILNFILVF